MISYQKLEDKFYIFFKLKDDVDDEKAREKEPQYNKDRHFTNDDLLQGYEIDNADYGKMNIILANFLRYQVVKYL